MLSFLFAFMQDRRVAFCHASMLAINPSFMLACWLSYVFTVQSELLALLGKMSCDPNCIFSRLTDLLCRQRVWASVTGWNRGQRTHGGIGRPLGRMGA